MAYTWTDGQVITAQKLNNPIFPSEEGSRILVAIRNLSQEIKSYQKTECKEQFSFSQFTEKEKNFLQNYSGEDIIIKDKQTESIQILRPSSYRFIDNLKTFNIFLSDRDENFDQILTQVIFNIDFSSTQASIKFIKFEPVIRNEGSSQ